MIRQVLAVAGHPERVARAVVWARTPVRVAPATTPGWTWVAPDPGTAGTPPMGKVADEASAAGTAVLVTVTPQRSEVQVWRDEKQVGVLGVDTGRVRTLDHGDAVGLARRMLAVLPRADERAVVAVLRAPGTPRQAWRALVEALGVPLPSTTPGPEWSLEGAPDVVTVSASTLREAGRVAGREAPLSPVPETEPEAWWRSVLRVVAILVVVGLVAFQLASGEPRVFAVVGAVVAVLWLVPGLRTAVRRSRARRSESPGSVGSE